MSLYIVTVIDADSRELIEQSEEPVELKFLVAEGRDVAEAAWHILLARHNQALNKLVEEDE